LKLPQTTIRKTLEDISMRNYFLNKAPVAQEIRARIDKWDCIKLKSFCISKETVNQNQETIHRKGENLLQLFNT
jgi:hypothetical protein